MIIYWIALVCNAHASTELEKHRANLWLSLCTIYTLMAESGRYWEDGSQTPSMIAEAYVVFRQSYNRSSSIF